MNNDTIKAAEDMLKDMTSRHEKALLNLGWSSDKAAELKEAARASVDYVMKREITENVAGITCAFINGAEYMQAQKDEQIKELVDAMINIINDINPSSSTCNDWETSDFLDGIIFWKSVPSTSRIIECIKLIRKHKQAR